jgi:hypothetical protein
MTILSPPALPSVNFDKHISKLQIAQRPVFRLRLSAVRRCQGGEEHHGGEEESQEGYKEALEKSKECESGSGKAINRRRAERPR